LLDSVEGTANSAPATVQNLSVDHRRSNIFVAEQFLNSSYIVTVFEQMRSEAMAKGMAGSLLCYSCLVDSLLYSPLQLALVEVMPAFCPGARVYFLLRRREEILPAPLAICVRILPLPSRTMI